MKTNYKSGMLIMIAALLMSLSFIQMNMSPVYAANYNVTLIANNESGDVSYEPAGDDGYTVPKCKFDAPEGKVFQGWHTSASGSGDWYDPGDSITLDSDLVLYARWSEPVMSVCSYDQTNSQSGQGGQYYYDEYYMYESGCGNFTVSLGEEISLTAYPDNGYAFVGWYSGKYISEDEQGNAVQDAEPYIDDDHLLSTERTYTFTVSDYVVICPVFKVATDLSGAVVSGIKAKIYTGKAQTQDPVVTLEANSTLVTLINNTDYAVAYKNNINAGTAAVMITGIGNYKGTIEVPFTISKAANPTTVKGLTVKVKYSKLKKKAQTVKRAKAIKLTKTQGTVTYKKAKGNKKITINKKNGKIKVKKGLKKGTYKIKVKVTIAGNKNYTATSKVVTVKIKVK